MRARDWDVVKHPFQTRNVGLISSVKKFRGLVDDQIGQ